MCAALDKAQPIFLAGVVLLVVAWIGMFLDTNSTKGAALHMLRDEHPQHTIAVF